MHRDTYTMWFMTVQKRVKEKPQLFLDSKTKRVMEALGWDFAKFKRAYNEEPGRRGKRAPSSEEIQAVEQFLKTGDLAALKKALRAQSVQTANAAVARVMAFKAQHKESRKSDAGS